MCRYMLEETGVGAANCTNEDGRVCLIVEGLGALGDRLF